MNARFFLRMRIWPTLIRAGVIALIGIGTGLIHNAFSDVGIPLRTPSNPLFSEEMNAQAHHADLQVTLSEAKRAFDTQEAVFIDARSSTAYRAGHIPGARNLPLLQHKLYAEVALKNLPKDTPIVTYCSGGGCRASIKLAQILRTEYGYTHVRAFYGGWPAWTLSGFPSAKGDTP